MIAPVVDNHATKKVSQINKKVRKEMVPFKRFKVLTGSYFVFGVNLDNPNFSDPTVPVMPTDKGTGELTHWKSILALEIPNYA